ncbi:uncharacterized protein IAS62_000814 [Cryptococcus decagattii]|uniref:Uncharacterized protein n=1 Tax=Cryptococcus decagattii TaxID=1859122 RepID=A0ABZ2AMF5_9TREE
MCKQQVSRPKEPLVGARGTAFLPQPRGLNEPGKSRKPVFGAGSMNLYAKPIPQTGFVRSATWKETTFVQCDLFTRLMQDRHPDLFTPEKYHSLWPLRDL